MDKLNELYDIKYKLLYELKKTEEKIKILEKERVSKCNHEFITERETGVQYGSKFTYCKHCGVNKVW